MIKSSGLPQPEFLRELSGNARPQCVSGDGRVAELATVW
jgi:hypothetical protein